MADKKEEREKLILKGYTHEEALKIIKGDLIRVNKNTKVLKFDTEAGEVIIHIDLDKVPDEAYKMLLRDLNIFIQVCRGEAV